MRIYRLSIVESIMLLFIIGIIGFAFISTRSISKSIESCSEEGKAIVSDVYRLRNRGYHVNYKYIVDGIEYYNSEKLKSNIELDKFSIGDTIDILYACKRFI